MNTTVKPRMNKAAKIRRLLRKGLTTKEISVEVGCTYNYVCVIRAEMKPKKAVPPAELGLASLAPKARPTAEERRVAAYMAYNISQGREVHKFSKERQTDERHQLIERVVKGVLYVASAGVCVAIAYVFTL
jgi:hypothetical protein